MREVFNIELMIHSIQFKQMMDEDDMKNYFKQKLAVEIAKKLIETNRTQFTYTKLHDRDMIRLSAKVEL
jgi:hypothetical protein